MKKIIPLYLLINLPMLLFLNGVFWDDWVLFNTETQFIYQRFRESGIFLNWFAYYHHLMMGVMGPWAYKFLTLIIFIANGYLFTIILKSNGVQRSTRIIFLIVYVAVPMFTSRYAAINTPYLIAPFLFFIGWILMRKNLFLSLMLFTISFSVQSWLVVYLIPFLLYCKEIYNKQEIEKYKFQILIFGLLPIVFFFIKNIYYPAYGLYQGYLTIDFSKVWPALMRIPVVTSWTINEAISKMALLDYLVAITMSLLIYQLLKVNTFKNIKPSIEEESRSVIFMLTAVFGIFLAIIPYALVGNEVNFYYGFESRNQSVLIFPFSFFLALLIDSFFKKYAVVPFKISLLVVSIFSMIQFGIYNAYSNDWNKTINIIKEIKKLDLDSKFNFVIKDDTKIKFVENRRLSDYEWSGIIRYSKKRDRVYARDEAYWNGDVCKKDFYTTPLYNTQKFEKRDNNLVTRITLTSSGGFRVPFFGQKNYIMEAKVDEGLNWCFDVCKKCGFE
jgi:hypothetical protein